MTIHQKLHELFLLDAQVRGLQSRLDAAQRRQNAQQTKLDRLNQQKSELQSQLKQTQAHAATLESESQGIEEKVNKLREQMNTAKTNKEYSAFLVEVNTFKDSKGKIEEDALKHLEEVDRLAAEIKEIEDKAADQQKLVDHATSEVKECRSEVGARLDQLTIERDEAGSALPQPIMQQFMKIAEDHEGESMSQIIEESRRHKEYTCGGCFVMVPIERVSMLMSRPDEVVCCPSCGRILYIEAELKSALTG